MFSAIVRMGTSIKDNVLNSRLFLLLCDNMEADQKQDSLPAEEWCNYKEKFYWVFQIVERTFRTSVK